MCSHGYPTYSIDDCQLSPSHHTQRNMTPMEVMVDYTKKCDQESKKAKSLLPQELGVSYGSTEAQKIDFYGEAGLPRTAPYFIFVHGGYWQEGSRSVSAVMANSLTTDGFIVGIVGYDLAPTVRVTDICNEIHRAIEFVLERAKARGSLGVYVCGHSAGAHLIAMALTKKIVNKNIFSGAILMSGVFELKTLMKTYIGEAVKLDTEEVKKISPTLLVDDIVDFNADVPIYVVVGDDESNEFKEQSKNFYRMLVSELDDSAKRPTLTISNDVDHFTILLNLASKESEIYKNVLSFVNR